MKMDELERRFDAEFEKPSLFKPIFHNSGFVAPYHPVVSNEDIRLIQFFKWGLIPSWTKNEHAANKLRIQTLNARAETIHEKPSFRSLIMRRRCLVLVDGFYEWREFRKKKYPYYIKLTDNRAFALAGIWDTWNNPSTGDTLKTFSIVTTRANALLEIVHNTRKRMPVILKQEDEKKWLTEDLDISEVDRMLNPYDAKEMEAYTVSRLISTRGKDTNTPEVMSRYEYAEVESSSNGMY